MDVRVEAGTATIVTRGKTAQVLDGPYAVFLSPASYPTPNNARVLQLQVHTLISPHGPPISNRMLMMGSTSA